MHSFVLAITTYNRIAYLKDCIESWLKTRSDSNAWVLIVADDGSVDGSLEYIENLSLHNTEVVVIKNKRIGVHQQVNTIIKKLEELDYDFCFKVDDDIFFKEKGWDLAYFSTAMNTGFHHLVFCDENWCAEQFLEQPKRKAELVGRLDYLNVHGFFYTISPQVIRRVGYFDIENFGFRGMGHVDYTVRCARAGFTDLQTPWDIKESNKYLTTSKKDYRSALPSVQIAAYDEMNRKRKEKVIQDINRLYIAFQKINERIFTDFKNELIEALSYKVEKFEAENEEMKAWYVNELHKTQEWYQKKLNKLPTWYVSIGNKFFK